MNTNRISVERKITTSDTVLAVLFFILLLGAIYGSHWLLAFADSLFAFSYWRGLFNGFEITTLDYGTTEKSLWVVKTIDQEDRYYLAETEEELNLLLELENEKGTATKLSGAKHFN